MIIVSGSDVKNQIACLKRIFITTYEEKPIVKKSPEIRYFDGNF